MVTTGLPIDQSLFWCDPYRVPAPQRLKASAEVPLRFHAGVVDEQVAWCAQQVVGARFRDRRTGGSLVFVRCTRNSKGKVAGVRADRCAAGQRCRGLARLDSHVIEPAFVLHGRPALAPAVAEHERRIPAHGMGRARNRPLCIVFVGSARPGFHTGTDGCTGSWPVLCSLAQSRECASGCHQAVPRDTAAQHGAAGRCPLSFPLEWCATTQASPHSPVFGSVSETCPGVPSRG